MTATLIAVFATAFVGVLGSWLTYLATRKRDAPQTSIDQRRLELEDAKAALEAWAEYATTVREDVAEFRRSLRVAEGRIILLQTERADHVEQLEKAREHIHRMTEQVDALQGRLDDCKSRLDDCIAGVSDARND